MTFIVAALLHPEIQKVAQEELDAVTMRERLPTFEDRSRLPFIEAICMEVTRWRPIAPLGELLSSTCLTGADAYDESTNPQVCPTQPHKMTFMKVTLSRRVGTPSEQTRFSCWLIRILRCNCDNECMVRYPTLFVLSVCLQLFFVGRSFMTRPYTQIQIPSNLNDSSTRMEASVMIQCWR
jgi:hypothetical protein